MTNEELTEIEALRNTILDQLAYHETAQAENASLKDEVAKLRQRLSIRENLRERIAQLNTKLAIAEFGPREAIQQRNAYIKDLVTECDHFSKKADALAAENARLREALAIKDPITELYRKSWEKLCAL